MNRLEELIQELCPDGVEFKSLGEVCKLVTGATPSKTRKEYWKNGTIPWMSSGEVNNKRIFVTESKITQEGYDCTSTTIVPIHSVVIALAGQGKTRGKVAITEIELCTNQSLCSIICNESLDYRFLYYYLDGKYEELRAISNGNGSRGGLSLRILIPYKIPVPPLPVQSEIVRFLDNFTELTFELTEKLSAELSARKKQYEYYRNKLLIFENGISVEPLGNVCDVTAGGTPSKKNSDYWTAGTVKWLGSTVCKNQKTVDEVTDYITEKGLAESSAKLMKKGTTLIALVGATIGKVAFLPFEAAINQNIAGIYPKDTKVLNPSYVYYACTTMYSKFLALTQGTKLAMANMAFVRSLQIPVPSIEAQGRIVNFLDSFDAICSDLNVGLSAEIEARQKQYEYYRDKLLTFKERTP